MNLIDNVGQGKRGWRRVSWANPCLVCSKPDWCLVTPDGTAALCARVETGAVKRCGAAGWLHRLGPQKEGWSGTRSFTVPLRSSADAAGWRDLADRYKAAVDLAALDRLAGLLGVRAESLRRLGVGWCSPSKAWSFPMVDAVGRVRGIRLRTSEGRKFAVRGGHDGLFVPEGLDAKSLLLIGEGLTDTAALLDQGFATIGRPSCMGSTRLVLDLVRRDQPLQVVIVADGDGPGQRGAQALAVLLAAHSSVRIVTPPAGVKDARAWVRAGATRDDLLAAIAEAPVHRLTVRMTVLPPARSGRRRHGR